MSVKTFRKLYLSLAIIFWLLLTYSNISIFFYTRNIIHPDIADFLTNYCLCLFILCVFLFFKIEIGKQKHHNQNEYLWMVFITGTSTILISLFIRFFIFSKVMDSLLLYTIFYHINLGLITIFIASAFYVWKKLIMYHRSARTNILWHIFEYLVLIGILSSFFIFDITQITFYIYVSPILILACLLCFNLKWIAFLNYKHKIRSIILMTLILLISVTFIQQIYEHQLTNELSVDLWDNVFILGMFAFISMYAFISVLVIMFHLPTSSVFEKKIEEVKVFQRLNQSIQEGDSEEHIYQLLLQSGISSVNASSGWLEIVDQKGNYKAFINQTIDKIDVFEIKKVLRKNHISAANEPYYIKSFKNLNHSERIQGQPYKSSVLLPLSSNNEMLGTLVLIQNESSGFDKTAIDVLYAFVSQASLAIKNYRLVSEALEHQRYREEVKIAKEVQKRLLPAGMMVGKDMIIHAFSKAADDVGGDYYDIFQHPNDRLSLVIGDVSGHGTTAAFNMAQMKGIFQSLIQLGLPADEFMFYANNAVGNCLEKKSFITLSLFNIDPGQKSFEFARAGHCQSLYYSSASGKVEHLSLRGLGLGIIRDESYRKHTGKQKYNYRENDLLMLYTDGIIEATNPEGEEFGLGRLQEILEKNPEAGPKQLTDQVLDQLYIFTGNRSLNDDYSIIVVKFV